MDKIYNEEFLIKTLKSENKNNNNNNNNSQLEVKVEINNKNIISKEKNKNLNLGRIYSLISCLFYSICDINLKIIQIKIPNFNLFFMMALRFLIFCLIGKLFIIKNNIKIKGLFYIENKALLLLRILGSLFGILFLKLSLTYIRFGLSVSLLMLSPIWANFLSIYFFKEKFELKYIISCIVCLFGTYLICLGENKGNQASKDYFDIYIGIFFGLLSSFSICISVISSKGLLKAYNNYELIYLLGFYSFLLSIFLSLLQYQLIYETLSLYFILITLLSGICYFYANHFSFLSFNLADINKISYINYMQIILSLISGFFMFNENLGLLDIIGGGIIIGFNYITTKYFK